MKSGYLICIAWAALASGGCSLVDDARAGSADGTLRGQVVLVDGNKQRAAGAGVVVYFEAASTLDSLPGTKSVMNRTVEQKERTFIPELTVVPKGGTVAFPNLDRVFHNVFSLSKTRRFDLGLFRDGTSRSVTFKRSGLVDVYCNIHPEMSARVMVVPNHFYALTDAKGRFEIPGVPAGSYTVVAWNGKETRAEVQIKAAETAQITMQLQPAPKRKRHVRKDGTPYRRYR